MKLASKFFLPWLVLIIILLVSLLMLNLKLGQINREVLGHIDMHQQAVEYAVELRFRSQERLAGALAMHAQGVEIDKVEEFLERSETETALVVEALFGLFNQASINQPDTLSDAPAVQTGLTILNDYTRSKKAMPQLYREWLGSLTGAFTEDTLEWTALFERYQLVSAIINDLAVFHTKLQKEVLVVAAEESAHFKSIFNLTVLLVLFLGSVVTLLIIRQVVSPIKHLSEVAQNVAQGRDQLFSAIGSADEVGVLSQSLLAMQQKLRKADQDRRHYQEDLERQVTLRTAALSEKSHELQVALKDLEAFSYSVSHDLRSPLRAIDGFIEIILDEHSKTLDQEGVRMFQVVQTNAKKMAQLIEDILAFSRAGRLEMDWQAIELTELVDEVWRTQIAESGSQAQLEVSDQLPRVYGDPRAVRQIFSNLITNALKFSRDRTPAIVQISAQFLADDRVQIQISDNGVGFDSRYKDKLFVMFQRLHGMNEFEGTGVGLAIVKRFVQKHGGTVEADAELNGGAVFSFTLPSTLPNEVKKLSEDFDSIPKFTG